MKLYSWNVNGLRAVLKKDALLPFIKAEQPDVLCLQEIKISSEAINKELPKLLAVGTEAKPLYLDGAQGDGEQRTEPYQKYGEGVAETATQRSAKSIGSAAGSAGRQANALQRLGYEQFWYPADKPGYSGTAILSKTAPRQTVNGLPRDLIDQFQVEGDVYGDPNLEGRVIAAEYEQFWLVTAYTPNAKDDLSRLPLRQKWDMAITAYCADLQQSKPVVYCGDMNVAHTPDDLANPKSNKGKKGFTEEERSGFDNWLAAGFVDTFRMFKQGNGYYSWWSHFANARARNVGWRIDYFLASESLKGKIKAAEIHPKVMGSDHCPVSLELEL